MKKHKLFDLGKANLSAQKAYQKQLSNNLKKKNLSVLVCFFESLQQGRFYNLRDSYPTAKLVRFESELASEGSYKQLADKVYLVLEEAGKGSRLFALDEGRLTLILRLEGDKMWAHVQYRTFGVEEPEYTRASIVLNEELETLGALDPCVEVYFQ